jgi:hypothetical protein
VVQFKFRIHVKVLGPSIDRIAQGNIGFEIALRGMPVEILSEKFGAFLVVTQIPPWNR